VILANACVLYGATDSDDPRHGHCAEGPRSRSSSLLLETSTPTRVIERVAAQMGVADPSVAKGDAEAETRWDRQGAIRSKLGYRALAEGRGHFAFLRFLSHPGVAQHREAPEWLGETDSGASGVHGEWTLSRVKRRWFPPADAQTETPSARRSDSRSTRGSSGGQRAGVPHWRTSSSAIPKISAGA
jgi:hypothetical protein